MIFSHKGYAAFTSTMLHPYSEINDEPSQTVPDQSIPFKDIIAKHLAGHDMATRTPVYLNEGTPVPEGFERMSKVDKLQMANELAHFVSTTRGQIISARQAAIREEHERRIIEAHEAKKAAAATDNVVKPVEGG